MKFSNIACGLMYFVSAFVLTAEIPVVTFALSNENETKTLQISKLFLNEIAKRMNVRAQIIQLPSNRMTWMLQHNQIHAEVYRVKSYKNISPNAIMVKESIATLPHYAYTTNPNIIVNGWKSLLPYSQVIVRGYEYSRENLKNHNVHVVNDIIGAFNFVKAKRADMIICAGLLGDQILHMNEFKNSGIVKLKTPVEYLDLHTFFGSQYPALALKYEKALKDLKHEGFINKLTKQMGSE